MPHIEARIVEPAERAATLAGTALGLVTLDPNQSIVVVVQVDGQLAACWAAMNTVHVEGIEVLPDYQGHAGVGRALLVKMLQALKEAGITEVLTQAATPEVEAMIEKLGGHRLPGSTWTFTVP